MGYRPMSKKPQTMSDKELVQTILTTEILPTSYAVVAAERLESANYVLEMIDKAIDKLAVEHVKAINDVLKLLDDYKDEAAVGELEETKNTFLNQLQSISSIIHGGNAA